MANIFEIPVKAGTPQRSQVSILGVYYHITLRWNESALGGWVLDLADADDEPIILGVPLVTNADLLAQYPHLDLGFALYVRSTPPLPPDAVPTFENFGIDSHFYCVTD